MIRSVRLTVNTVDTVWFEVLYAIFLQVLFQLAVCCKGSFTQSWETAVPVVNVLPSIEAFNCSLAGQDPLERKLFIVNSNGIPFNGLNSLDQQGIKCSGEYYYVAHPIGLDFQKSHFKQYFYRDYGRPFYKLFSETGGAVLFEIVGVPLPLYSLPQRSILYSSFGAGAGRDFQKIMEKGALLCPVVLHNNVENSRGVIFSYTLVSYQLYAEKVFDVMLHYGLQIVHGYEQTFGIVSYTFSTMGDPISMMSPFKSVLNVTEGYTIPKAILFIGDGTNKIKVLFADTFLPAEIDGVEKKLVSLPRDFLSASEPRPLSFVKYGSGARPTSASSQAASSRPLKRT